MTGDFHSFRARLPALLKKQPWMAIVAEAFLMVLLIGYLDYVTGYEISLFVFYCLPIVFAVWYGDRNSGVLVAVLSTIIWSWSDEKAGHPYMMTWIKGWDTAVRLAFFLFVAVGMSALKNQYELIKRSRRLERQIIRTSEREKQRIGQELHDGLCQYFAAISCAASTLTDDLQSRSAEETEAAAEIAQLLSEGVVQTRNLARGLFPVQKHESGLESALCELASSMSRLLNIECKFEPAQHVQIHDNEAATHLYRITQEALHNAKRHGRATRVIIALAEEAGHVMLEISDNGKGLGQADGKADGMGLKIMDYRARQIGGKLEVKNREGGGTVVRCAFVQAAGEKAERKG